MNTFLSLMIEIVSQSNLVIEIFWKSIIIFSAAAVTAWIFRKQSASLKHWIWSLSLICLMLLPLFSNLLPHFTFTWLPPGKSAQELTKPLRPNYFSPPPQTFQSRFSDEEKSAAADRTLHNKESRHRSVYPAGTHLIKLMTLIWAAGTIFHLVRYLNNMARLQHICRSGKILRKPGAMNHLEIYKKKLGIKQRVNLILSPQIPVPALYGYFRPVILLPCSFSDWAEKRQAAVLLHELAHLKRRDHLTKLCGQVSRIIYWFHPLVAAAVTRQRKESDKACDDYVVVSGISDLSYAGDLLEIARDLSGNNSIGKLIPTLARKSELKSRLIHILSAGNKRTSLSRTALTASVFSALLLLLPLTVMTLGKKDTPVKKAPSERFVKRLSTADFLHDLRYGGPEGKKRAAWALGEKETPQAVPDLITVLSDKNPEVRSMAAWALGEIKDARALKSLAAGLNDKDPLVREIFVKSLGELEDPRAIPELIPVLQDHSADVRASAVWALGEIKNKKAYDTILTALHDPDSKVREMVVYIIGGCRIPHYIQALYPLLEDKKAKIRGLTAKALSNLKNQQTVEKLIPALSDSSSLVREETAYSLGKIGLSTAVDALIHCLRDKNAEVRSAAVWALDEIHLDTVS